MPHSREAHLGVSLQIRRPRKPSPLRFLIDGQKDNQDDNLSKLPNDILLAILDQLDVRDAARTSVLSKRWRQLPAMLSRLVIDVKNFRSNGAFKPSMDALVHTNVAVAKATNSMLSRRKSSEYIIQLLHMTFYLRDDDSISIGRTIWVQPEDPKRLASMFHKLRVVNLIGVPEGCDLTWTMFILDAAPSLKELYITFSHVMQVWNHVCEMKLDKERRRFNSCREKNVKWEAYNVEHHSLSTLTMFNFQPEDYIVRHIRRVMEVAVNLDDIKAVQEARVWLVQGQVSIKAVQVSIDQEAEVFIEEQNGSRDRLARHNSLPCYAAA
ncbi:hypothetical protein PR202_ga03358 [Eleusine coracana subsp. coracana]|uniref:F-box domain-containing protein n=1 Tax=Eleusine coracana subsp. coracana TaxID=191504 RepID=A0AAV5BP88_ELECO|nr:hypothetical protein PR202_ga03358 [Eleusine coracana subsp. coracana]